MPYKVHKLIQDRRNNTCGFFLPNGGFYHVVEMTFENHKQLSDLSKRPGYTVDFVEGDTGFFDKDGFEVEESSVKVNKISKVVEDYQRKKRSSRGKETEVKKSHAGKERSGVLEEVRKRGLRVDETASTQAIKAALERSSSPRQVTLSSNLA